MRSRIKYSAIVVLVIVILLSSTVFIASFLLDLEMSSYDYRLLLKGILEGGRTEDIIIVEIDDSSLDELGSWPWPRSKHAEMIEFLNNAGAEVIAFDILFSDETNLEDEQKLVEALAMYDNVLLPYTFDLILDRSLNSEEIRVIGYNYPHNKFKSESHLAYINLITDRDGKIRRAIYPPDEADNSFALKTASLYRDETLTRFNEEAFINYRQQNFFSIFSYHRVIAGEVSPEFFSDKIVLIGATSSSLKDDWATPLFSTQGYIPGVIIQATILNNYLNDNFIYKLNKIIYYFLLLVFIVLTFYLFYRTTPLKRLFLMVLLTFIVLLVAMILIIRYNLFLMVIPFLSVLMFNYIISNIILYFKLDKKRKKLYNLFSRYLAPEVLEEVTEKKELDYLKGERVEISVLFIDLVGFTKYAEKRPSDEVVTLLNRYFEVIVDETFKYQATLDKFIGDGAMIFLGAPIKQDNHALKAIELAESIQNKIRARKDLLLPLAIAINTGSVVVGNVGSAKRMEYTAIGAAVNIAARIENEAEANQILIGEQTYQATKDNFDFSAPLKFNFKGISKDFKVYKLNKKAGD